MTIKQCYTNEEFVTGFSLSTFVIRIEACTLIPEPNLVDEVIYLTRNIDNLNVWHIATQ
jgi:hypothetical protein